MVQADGRITDNNSRLANGNQDDACPWTIEEIEALAAGLEEMLCHTSFVKDELIRQRECYYDVC